MNQRIGQVWEIPGVTVELIVGYSGSTHVNRTCVLCRADGTSRRDYDYVCEDILRSAEIGELTNWARIA